MLLDNMSCAHKDACASANGGVRAHMQSFSGFLSVL